MSSISKFFKAYDIRGTYPELNEKVYFLVGYALCKIILTEEGLPTEINIVHDTRYTSPKFYQALYNGIKAGGGMPRALGLGSTDFMYAACQVTQTPGVMVTASHNPKNDNGMKIVKHGAQMLGMESGLDKIRDWVVANYETFDVDQSSWLVVNEDLALKDKVTDYYRQKIAEIGQITKVNQQLKESGKRLKIAVDAGNGMGGWVMEQMQDLYTNIDFVPLYWEPDGNFPNHPADPQNLDNLQELMDLVKVQHGISLGVAFDGDADRAFFVDESGTPIQGDFLVAFFARTLIRRQFDNPKTRFTASAVYLQPGSRCVPEAISEVSGIAIPSKQGHTFIKEQMAKNQSVYGGEFSGHHYFGDFGFMDAGILAVVLLIEIMVNSEKPISQTFSQLASSYFISPLMNLRLPEGGTFDEIKHKLMAGFADAVFNQMDGICVNFPNWRFSMRPSNTEPVVRFILETRFTDQITEKVNLVKQITGLN